MMSMRAGPAIRGFTAAVAIGMAVCLQAPAPAQAQTAAAPSASDREASDRLTYFYRKPALGEVPDLMRRLTSLETADRAGPSIVGFIAGLAKRHPDRIKEMFPPSLPLKAQQLAFIGVGAARPRAEALALAKSYGLTVPDDIKLTFSLNDKKAEGAQEFDFFWGASFATGDGAYVRPILEHYRSVAERPDIKVKDIVAVVAAQQTKKTDELTEMRARLGDDKLVEIVVAASALWSLNSNATQHAFVKKEVDDFLKRRKGTPAAEGLIAARALQ